MVFGRNSIVAFAIFLVFFLALFAQFPLQQALPGNTDTILTIAVTNSYLAKLASLFGFGDAGRAMYPVPNIIAYGEAAPGIAAWFGSLKLLGLSDWLAYYIYVVLTFTLTAWATFVFAGRFVASFGARMFAGFAFACSNMMFAHIDDPYHVFWFFPLFAFIALDRGLREQKNGLILTAALLGGIQVYFSIYIFIYQSAALGVLITYHWLLRGARLDWYAIARNAAIYVAIAFPLWAFYSWMRLKLNIVPVYEPAHITRVMSWQPRDLLLALPDNLLYGWITDLPQNWPQLRHHNLIGLLVILSASFALTRRGEHRPLLGGLALTGLILSLGPWFMWGYEAVLPTPLYPLYKWFPIFSYHRIPVRAYFLVLLALSVLAAITLDVLLRRFPARRAAAGLLTLFVAVHIVENVPFPMRAYKVGPLLETPSEYRRFLDGKQGAVIVDLPTRFGFQYLNWSPTFFHRPEDFVYANPAMPRLEVADYDSVALSSQDVFLYIRDAYYMNWQTQHRQNIVGGVAGYFPASRLVFEGWINELPAEHAVRWLREQGVQYIAYHREMLLPGDKDILAGLRASPLLRVALDGERTVVFTFVENEG